MPVRQVSLDEIARTLGGRVLGDPGRLVSGVCEPDRPYPEEIAPVWERDRLVSLPEEQPVLLPPGWGQKRIGVECEDPRRALIPLLALWRVLTDPPVGIHFSAVVEPGARVAPDAVVGPGCVVRSGAVVGSRAVLVARVYLGPGVVIGEGSRAEPGVVVHDRVEVGRDCILRAGTVLGADGFGYIEDESGSRIPIPQIGRVVLEDRVEVGALSAIDRATFGETRIGAGTKIDNLVQIGHNCRIGRDCIVVAMSGVSGSARVGDRVVLAARSSVKDHVSIGDRAVVAGNAGVTKDVPPGRLVSGFPAREHREELRIQALTVRLPDLYDRIRALEKEIARLKERLP
jgi:UDP-3-O-[3-hydroxymyristoyl] glucosamine N-acyltransferase